jgi:hypothetical protein
MALDVLINDSNFNISTGQNIAYVTTDTTGVFKFRFLMELTYKIQGITTPVTKTISFTQQQNQDGQAVFNLSEIYKSIVTPQISPSLDSDAPTTTTASQKGNIHTLPNFSDGDCLAFSGGLLENSTGYEAFKGVANVMTLKFYEMYSTTADGIPVKDPLGIGAITKTIFMFWGRGQEDEGVIVDFEPYKLDGTTKNLLNCNRGYENGYYNIDIGKDEYHTIAFLNRCAINTGVEVGGVVVKFYTANNVLIADLEMANLTATGGSKDVAGTGTDETFYLYCAIGIENMEKLDFTSADYTFSGTTFADGKIDGVTIGKYIVYPRDFTWNRVSNYYRFNVVTYCSQYDQSRLAYMNRFGAWDYITLNKERKDELKVKKEYITKPIINQATGLSTYAAAQINTAYPLDVAKQGMMTTSVAPTITTKMFTDYLPEDKIEQIKDLMMSPQIHLLDGDNAKALILETSTMKLKREKNRGLYQYELKFSFANPKFRTT